MKRTFYSDSAELHEAAGQYVLGTLPSAQRRAVEEQLPHDVALQAAVQEWETRLLPLADLVAPVEPPERLWRRIERSASGQSASTAPKSPASRLGRAAKPAAPARRIWNSLALWRGLAVASLATVAVLTSLLLARTQGSQPAPEFMVVLVAPESKAPGWVIEASMPRQVRLIPLATVTVPKDKALQFWTKGTDWTAPVSLGLVKPGEPVRISLDQLPPLQPDQLFELTLEPAGGSPTGRPTGPIQFIGRAVKVS